MRDGEADCNPETACRLYMHCAAHELRRAQACYFFLNPYISNGLQKLSRSLYNGVLQKPKTLNKFGSYIVGMVRKFEEWWNTVPADLKQKARKGDESNKPLLNQINYAFLHLHLAGKHDAKPTHDELKDWLHSGQVDVIRMTKK